jgi:hypothetical protein
MEYWALGLEPVYLEGALARALGRWPESISPSSGENHGG